MPVTAKVDEGQIRIGLGELRAGVTDLAPLLEIAGNLMRSSITRTFREEGSPAGSWPKLALSTLRNKKYTSGHKLLIMSNRMFTSITYIGSGNTLIIGTNVVYAPVHQWGSRDYRGNFTGPLSKAQHEAYEAERVDVAAHQGSRLSRPRYGNALRTAKNGRMMNVRVRLVGPQNRKTFEVGAHKRHQNIPPRPFLVFRPEDPQRMAMGIEAYLAQRAGKIGAVAKTGGAQ